MEQFVHSLVRYGPHGEGRAAVLTASGKSPISYAEKQERRKKCCSAGFSSGKESFSHRLGRSALRKREGMRGKKKSLDKDELSEDYCFVCKDGGEIRVCDFKGCLKSYHAQCVGKDVSFLQSCDSWNCGWHSCYNCSKYSTFKCFCCPYSSCRTCVGDSDFVQIKGFKGLCHNCLRMAKLIEENADVDSDGDVVDFNDTDTFEFLFKDYWIIVKEKEGLTLAILQSADALLKRGEKFKVLSDPDEHSENQHEFEETDDECAVEDFSPKDFKRKYNCMKMAKEKSKSKKRIYIGWASKELIDFLSSLGNDTHVPLAQPDVYEIVKEYIQSKNLLHHDKKKKKHVFCDANLLPLFRRKKINFFKVYSLLEKHLAENDDSDDETLNLEEDDYVNSTKKRRRDKPSNQKMEHIVPKKSCFAAITEDNIKSIYLKRSLIVELLEDPVTFETKVVGCFVRRKNDTKDFYGPPPKMYQLDQIICVRKASNAYKLGDTNVEVVLRVANYWKDVQISMLSDDYFEEEECEALHQLVKKGLFKRPTIDELKQKIKAVHEDIVKHSVRKELLRLDKLIERANEKGWRKELFDYMDRKKFLNKPEEVMRLIKQLPEVTADVEAVTTEGVRSNEPRDLIASDKIIVEDKGVHCDKSRDLISSDNIILNDKGVHIDKSGDLIKPVIVKDKAEAKLDGITSKENDEGHETHVSKEAIDACAIEVSVEKTGTNGPAVDIVDVYEDDDGDAANGNPVFENQEKIWNYMDPSGNVQGPFCLGTLKYWKDEGFFDEDFRIWKVWQSQENAIALGVALGFFQAP